MRNGVGNTLWRGEDGKVRTCVVALATVTAVPGSAGVGEFDVRGAKDKNGGTAAPPKPNLPLENYRVRSPSGPVCNVDGWVSEEKHIGASWSSASWASGSWASSCWSSASWASSADALALVNNASLDTAGDG